MRFSKAMYPGAVILAVLMGAVGSGVLKTMVGQGPREARFRAARPQAAFEVAPFVPPVAFRQEIVPAQPTEVIKATYRVSAPVTHEHLSIFLVHGPDQLDTSRYLTLNEAMERRAAVVRDQHSNVLAIDNRSSDETVIVFSGDVLEGGYQDRVAQHDMIASAGATRVPLPAFCVEATRSHGPEGFFRSNPDQVASHGLRLATRLHGNQTMVWEAVSQVQNDLASNVGVHSVKSPQSSGQLVFSLQHQEVRDSADKYVRTFQSLGTGDRDVIGYGFAINGRIRAVDVYGSADLFRKVWPKLLRATAIEAVAERRGASPTATFSEESVERFLADMEKGHAVRRDLQAIVRLTTQDAPHAVLFETRDVRNPETWLRRNYLAKTAPN